MGKGALDICDEKRMGAGLSEGRTTLNPSRFRLHGSYRGQTETQTVTANNYIAGGILCNIVNSSLLRDIET